MKGLLLGALIALSALAAARPAAAQDQYGSRGIFPVYEASGQWTVFDKDPKLSARKLALGSRLLVIGTEGAQLFEVRRSSSAWGAVCLQRRPARVRAAWLRGPRKIVGRPIIGISVPPRFSLRGSRALYRSLKSEVDEQTYGRLLAPLKQSAVDDVKSGAFRFKLDDGAAEMFIRNPDPDKVQVKIDFGARVKIAGLSDPFVFVEETQISASTRRCLRIADGDKLVGGCAEMPYALMAETDLLQFVSYDPSGAGNPFILALTTQTPLWGDERWGFIARRNGPRLFLMDAMDPRCRESF